MSRQRAEADEPAPTQPDDLESPKPPARPRRWRRWLALAIVLVLAGWFVRFAYLRITLRPTPRPAYWEAKLAALDPPPPGAISSQAAFAILNNRPWESDPALTKVLAFGASDVLCGEWNESRADIAMATKLFESAEFNEARAKLKDAVEHGWRDEISLSFEPYLPPGSSTEYRPWANWLTAHSRWSVEHNSDVQTAVEDWIITLKLARQRRRTPLPFDVLTADGVVGSAVREMARFARESAFAVDSLGLAREIDAVVGPVVPPREMLAGTRIYWMANSDHIYVRKGGDWLDVSEAASPVPPTGTWTPAGAPSRLWNLTSPLFHDLPTARARVEEAMDALEGLDTMAAAIQARDTLSAVGPGILDGATLGIHSPRSSDATFAAYRLGLHYRVWCQLDATLAMLALHAYHDQHGAYPDRLQELVPDFLHRMPIDYADRKPLRYRLTDDGYLLYSIGANGKDDGGRYTSPDATREDNPDMVFSAIRRSELRK